MPDSHVVEESYVNQRLRWYRRWRWPLILFTIIVWLPVLILLQWKLHISTILQEQGFYWLPGLDTPDLSLWHRLLLRLSYNLEYYTQVLMRVIAVAAAIALAVSYPPVASGRGGDRSGIYLDYRHAVRRAVY
ncbi:MAG TPA: hypothetical protein ENO21_00275, partial [Firmicutes bacterium]|nr:hypothetical protein [Bacillota bacterium]